MRKRSKCVFLATAMAVTTILAAGCGNSASGGQNTADSAERVPIRWLTTGDAAAEAIQDNDRIIEAINEKLGIDLTVEIVPEANTEKVNVAMASGDFPDVVTGAYGTSATQQWIDDGMVIPLNDYMDSFPSMKAWLENYEWSAQNGKYYGMPFITQYSVANTLIVMRQDWLDNLGLSYPQTLDENDQVIPVFEDPAFVKGMTYIKELWDAGAIDPELMLNDMSKKEEKFYQGKAGMMPAPLFRHVTRHENSVRELFPDASICYDLSPAGPDGARGLSKQGKSGMMTCITAACKNPDKAAAFVDFMVSEEGNNLLRLGIEGIHYTKDGDEIVFNEEERAKDAFSPNGWAHALAWGSFYWPLESNYIPVTDPNRERALHTVDLATQCQVPNLIKQKTQVEIENGAAVDDIYTQYFSDMLQGKLSIEEGVEQLSKSWRSQGGEEILEAVNAEYQKTKAKQ